MDHAALAPEETQTIEQELADIDAAIARARERKDLQKLLEFSEKNLFLRKRLYKAGSAEVQAASNLLVESCNYVATTQMQLGNTQVVLDLLRRAQEVNRGENLQKAITYNNLACYYRRVGKLRSALIYLEKAYALELLHPSADLSQTHLNLCATLSQLGKHDQALRQAQTALIKVFGQLTPLLIKASCIAGAGMGGLDARDSEQDLVELADAAVRKSQQVREKVSVLCIAFYNTGAEHEHLKNFAEAVQTYAEGLSWADSYLGGSHQITKILRHSSEALRGEVYGEEVEVSQLDAASRDLLSPRNQQNGQQQRPRSKGRAGPSSNKHEPPCISTHKKVFQQEQNKSAQKKQNSMTAGSTAPASKSGPTPVETSTQRVEYHGGAEGSHNAALPAAPTAPGGGHRVVAEVPAAPAGDGDTVLVPAGAVDPGVRTADPDAGVYEDEAFEVESP